MAMLPGQEEETDLDELLGKLEQGAKLPAAKRITQISITVDKVCQKAYEDGLAYTPLNKLIDIITLPNRLEQGSLAALIRHLYPASKVPDSIVIKVVGNLGHGRGKLSLTSQGLLLKWLVMVYDVLENQKIMSQLYSVLFNLLDTVAIRPQLCHVLALITRRKHVRPYRIQILMELIRQAGNEPPLIGLMRVYKDYYPDVIVGDTSGRASVFTHPNQEWRERLQVIQVTSSQRAQDSLSGEKQAFRVARKSASGTRRTRSSVLPEVHTSHAQESSVTLEEIDSVNDFIYKLEKIEPPNQLVAVIGDPLLQKFLQLRSSEASSKRIDDWLLAFFEDQLERQHSAELMILEMLNVVLEYTRYTKILPAGCMAYLKAMLPSWNGTTGREVILNLLAYTPIGPYEDLYTSIFQFLEDAILGDGAALATSRLALLTFYHTLLSRWSTILLSSPSATQDVDALTSLTTHTHTLALTLLTTSPSLRTQTTILSYLSTLTQLYTSKPSNRPTNNLRITIPPAPLLYLLAFTPSLTNLSLLCAILANYKRAFESQAANKQKTYNHIYQKAYLNRFNGYLMDICNCLWRMRSLSASDNLSQNALGCLAPPATYTSLAHYANAIDKEVPLPILFGLPHNSVTCLLADSYLRELEDQQDIEKRHRGPVTQRSLDVLGKDGGVRLGWTEYRVGILGYMNEKGVTGIGELMRVTVKGVIDSGA